MLECITSVVSSRCYSHFIDSNHKVTSPVKIEDRSTFASVLVRSDKAMMLFNIPRATTKDITVSSYSGETMGDVEALCECVSTVGTVSSVKCNGVTYTNPNEVSQGDFISSLEYEGVMHINCMPSEVW